MPDHTVSHSHVSGAARLLRGWSIAVLAVLLAAGGHQAAHVVLHGSSEAMPWQLLGFAVAMTAPVAVGLAARRTSHWPTVIATLFGQLAFHLLYSLPYAGSSLVSASSHATHVETAASAVMVTAHALAAAGTTLVMLYGERSLWTLVAWLTLTPARVALATPGLHVVRPQAMPQWAQVWIPHPMNVAKTRSSRGPPVLA